MLDLNVLLNETDETAERLATKGVGSAAVYSARDAVLRRRQFRKQLDDLRAEMNRGSKELGRLIASKSPKADKARERLALLKQQITSLEDQCRDADHSKHSPIS